MKFNFNHIIDVFGIIAVVLALLAICYRLYPISITEPTGLRTCIPVHVTAQMPVE